MPYKDPEKQKAAQREWMRKQREENTPYAQRQKAIKSRYRGYDREYNRVGRKRVVVACRAYVAEWRMAHRICTVCGEELQVKDLVLHHPENDGKGNLNRYYTSLGRVKREIERCILLCRKCHKKVHCEMVGRVAGTGYPNITMEVKR